MKTAEMLNNKALYYVLRSLKKEGGILPIDELIEKTVVVLYQNREASGGVVKFLEIDIDLDIGSVNITDKTRATFFNIIFNNGFATTGHFNGIAITKKGERMLQHLEDIHK